jgi:hypothetical protein
VVVEPVDFVTDEQTAAELAGTSPPPVDLPADRRLLRPGG